MVLGITTNLIDRGFERAAQKAEKKGKTLEAEIFRSLLKESQKAREEKKVQKEALRAEKLAQKEAQKTAKVQKTSEWGEELKEIEVPVLKEPKTKKEKYAGWKSMDLWQRAEIDHDEAIKGTVRGGEKSLHSKKEVSAASFFEGLENIAIQEEAKKAQLEKQEQQEQQGIEKKANDDRWAEWTQNLDAKLEEARKRAEELPRAPIVSSVPGISEMPLLEHRKVEKLPSDDLDAIRKHVSNYNVQTVLAVIFIAAGILTFISPIGIAAFALALNTLSARKEEKEAVEQIEQKYQRDHFGKGDYYKALAQKTGQGVKKPEFHFWGATHLRFV